MSQHQSKYPDYNTVFLCVPACTTNCATCDADNACNTCKTNFFKNLAGDACVGQFIFIKLTHFILKLVHVSYSQFLIISTKPICQHQKIA